MTELNTMPKHKPVGIDTPLLFDVVIIGGGSAGLAAAAAVAESGPLDVLLVERDDSLGGVLPQCVHDGFGLHLYGESLSGPEYARRWIDELKKTSVQVALASTVLSVRLAEKDSAAKEDSSVFTAPGTDEAAGLFSLEVIGVSLGGKETVLAKSVVCATGCRERTRGALQIPGGRPAGVLTAGSAQYMMNVANQMPGDKVVILGSGDIGLIMARRIALEGGQVRMVLGQEATGLIRNHINCIRDFDIPFRSGWGVASIHGFGQLQGVTVAPLNKDGSFDMTRKEYIRCNLLLIACGLIPEREVLEELDLSVEVPGLFICGNANAPLDLVDQVTQEGIRAGRAAAQYVLSDSSSKFTGLSESLQRIEGLVIDEPQGTMNELTEDHPSNVELILCTDCPKGCLLTIDENGSVTGNGCNLGVSFAHNELANPLRMFTGTVLVAQARRLTLLPVRTSRPIPKTKLFEIARICSRTVVNAPVKTGDVLLEDVADTGVSLIATDDRECTA